MPAGIERYLAWIRSQGDVREYFTAAERLLRARQEAGVDHVFLFPAHTRDGAYEMPEKEITAFERAIRPRLAG